MIRIGFICPTYDALSLASYTRKALESFFDTTPYGVAIVVDDGSVGWTKEYADSLYEIGSQQAGTELHIIRFHEKGGLTRSWNAGLREADELGLDYAIAGNNDVIFSYRWYEGLLHALTNGYDLAGPLSNAPGVTAQGLQEIQRYIPTYKVTDDLVAIDKVAAELQRKHVGKVAKCTVNGFFLMAALSTWRAGKYDDANYFCPVNQKMPSGRPNLTPLMTGNEDELQHRWRDMGLKSAVALSSFIFHYRAVSRGERYKKGLWYRQP